MTLIAKVEYGSTVYGTTTIESDIDFIQVLDDGVEFEPQLLNVNGSDINQYSRTQFQRLLNNQDISCLEAFYTPTSFIHVGDFSSFSHCMDLKKLRSKFSERSSNSWVKAKKKILVEKDQERIGLKSLFHSIRIIDFGCQLAETGKVYNFSSCNEYYWKILEIGADWNLLNSTFKDDYNKLCSRFRILAPL